MDKGDARVGVVTDQTVYKVIVGYARPKGRKTFMVIASDKYEAARKAH